MSDLQLTDADVETFTALAAVLIPGTSRMPAIGEIEAFDRLLRTAVKACGYDGHRIRAALDRVPAMVDMDKARAFAAAEPDLFHIVGELASAAYYMAPAVLNALNFPLDRRQPASQEDFADEYMTGIVDPVTERGPRYRDTRPGSGAERGTTV